MQSQFMVFAFPMKAVIENIPENLRMELTNLQPDSTRTKIFLNQDCMKFIHAFSEIVFTYLTVFWRQDSSVSTVTELSGVRIPAGKRNISVLQNAHTAVRPTQPRKGTRGMRLTTHLDLVPRLRMSGALPPLPL